MQIAETSVIIIILFFFVRGRRGRALFQAMCRSIQIWDFVMRRYRACWIRTAVPSVCLHLSLSAQYFLLFWKSHMLCDHVLAERIPRCIRNMTIYQLRSDNVRSFFIIRFEGCKIANILKTCNLAIFVSLGSEMLADCTILRSFSRFLAIANNCICWKLYSYTKSKISIPLFNCFRLNQMPFQPISEGHNEPSNLQHRSNRKTRLNSSKSTANVNSLLTMLQIFPDFSNLAVDKWRVLYVEPNRRKILIILSQQKTYYLSFCYHEKHYIDPHKNTAYKSWSYTKFFRILNDAAYFFGNAFHRGDSVTYTGLYMTFK